MFSLCGQILTNICLKTTTSKPLKECTIPMIDTQFHNLSISIT